MINYTKRLDQALRKAAWSHEKEGQHRKNSDIPYIIHPFGTMIIASEVTANEDVLIACLMHDVLEDVNTDIYNEASMRVDFGDNVVSIVKDVTKDDSISDWRERSNAYLKHLEFEASDEAIIVSASDKIHNLLSTIVDFQELGDIVWKRFKTQSSIDQVWWYEAILEVIKKRKASTILCDKLSEQISELKKALN